MSMLAQIAIAALLVIGGIFGAIGSWGLVRLPDPMTRLHAPTKAATLGVGAVLLGSMGAGALSGALSGHELLIALFLFVTSPVTGLFIAKAHLHLTLRRDRLPDPGRGTTWVTFADTETGSPLTAQAGAPRRPE